MECEPCLATQLNPCDGHGPPGRVGHILATSCHLNLRHGIFRPLEQSLHFFDINLGGGIVLVPHHLLYARGIRIIQQGKGWRGVPQAMHHNAWFLHARQEQTFRKDAVNRPRREL